MQACEDVGDAGRHVRGPPILHLVFWADVYEQEVVM